MRLTAIFDLELLSCTADGGLDVLSVASLEADGDSNWFRPLIRRSYFGSSLTVGAISPLCVPTEGALRAHKHMYMKTFRTSPCPDTRLSNELFVLSGGGLLGGRIVLRYVAYLETPWLLCRT